MSNEGAVSCRGIEVIFSLDTQDNSPLLRYCCNCCLFFAHGDFFFAAHYGKRKGAGRQQTGSQTGPSMPLYDYSKFGSEQMWQSCSRSSSNASREKALKIMREEGRKLVHTVVQGRNYELSIIRSNNNFGCGR